MWQTLYKFFIYIVFVLYSYYNDKSSFLVTPSINIKLKTSIFTYIKYKPDSRNLIELSFSVKKWILNSLNLNVTPLSSKILIALATFLVKNLSAVNVAIFNGNCKVFQLLLLFLQLPQFLSMIVLMYF